MSSAQQAHQCRAWYTLRPQWLAGGEALILPDNRDTDSERDLIDTQSVYRILMGMEATKSGGKHELSRRNNHTIV